MHSVSQRPNLRHLGEPLGVAKSLLEAVSFKKAMEGMGRGRVANARWERVPHCGGCNTETTGGKCSANMRNGWSYLWRTTFYSEWIIINYFNVFNPNPNPCFLHVLVTCIFCILSIMFFGVTVLPMNFLWNLHVQTGECMGFPMH